MDEDISLMFEVQRDDLKAFERLYGKYHKTIANFFFRMGCDPGSVHDCVQEVFMRIWRSRHGYRPDAKFTTFLFQIAKNYWINENDKKKRRPFFFSLSASPKNDDESARVFEIDSKDISPQDRMIEKEVEEKIRQAIASLKEKHRIVFILSEIEGLKYKEIADILGIPVGTVKSRIAIAEKKLRTKLAPYLTDSQEKGE